MKGEAMKMKIVSVTILTVLLVCMSSPVLDIHSVRASGTIYIRANGLVDGTDRIQHDGLIYTFIGNISDPIVVERSNIVIDGAGYALRGTGIGKGIDLSGRTHVTVRSMRIEGFADGIWLSGSTYSNITANTLTSNYDDGVDLRDSSDYNSIVGNNITDNHQDGIELWSSSHNSIAENSISQNHLHGVWTYDNSNYNDISKNTISENHYDGVDLLSSSNYNTVNNNTVENNHDDGITILSSSYNSVYQNQFINNTNQVNTDSSISTWDEGYPSGGNFWSDYNGTDIYSGPYQNVTGHDGIGDTPYIINSKNQDRFPLVLESAGGFGLTPWIIVTVVIVVCIVAATLLILRRRRPSAASPPPPPPPPPT